jgi:hypothetical protein
MASPLVVAVKVLFLMLLTTDVCIMQSADESIIFSTANEWMKDSGKPMTNFARKIGLNGVAQNPSVQAAEGVGMLFVRQVPAMQAARAVFHGTEKAGQFARGIASSASSSSGRSSPE